MTGQGSGGHSRLSRAHCQRPPTGVVTWVRGPPARTVWPHSMTGQGSGGHSRLSRAHCQRPRLAWSPGCAGLRPAPFGHIRGPTRAAEATRAYPVPAANASRPAWSPGCAVLQPTSCEVQKPIASYISQHFSSFPLPPQAEVNPSWQCVNKYDRQANKRLDSTPSKRKPTSLSHTSILFALLSPFTSARIR